MRPFLAAFLALLALPLAAETRQHGNVLYEIPPGWEKGAQRPDGTRILRSDLPDDACDTCRIYLSPGARTGGKVVDWLASQSRHFVEEDEDDPPKVTPMTASEVINISGRPGAMRGQTVDGDMQILLAVQLFGRMELVGFEGPASDADELAATMQVFQRDVMPMVEGLRFVSEGAKPLLPNPQPGARAGLWWGTRSYWLMGLDGMMNMEIDHHWLVFWPDGLFYSGIPRTGTQPLDRAALLERADMDWGTYSEDGKTLTLTFASGEVEVYDAAPDRLTDGDLSLFPVSPLPDGTKVDGAVSSFFYSGFAPGAGVSGGASSSSVTEFHPDGSWSQESVGGAFGTFDTGGFAVSSEDADGGRYEVKDGLMIRRDQAGAVLDHDFIFKLGSDIWIGSLSLGRAD
jgi:hypothetical protein